MLEAGRKMVRETGLTVSLEHLSFEEVIRQADVARSAAYKLWPRKEAYYLDLLYEVAGPDWEDKVTLDEVAIARAIEVVLTHRRCLETWSGRRWLLEEVVRRVVPASLRDLSKSTHWRSFVALTATLLSLDQDDGGHEIRERLLGSERRLLRGMAEFYSEMAAVLGLRVRATFANGDYLALVTVGAAMVEGMALRRILMPEGQGDDEIYTLDEAIVRDWSLPAIAFMSVVDAFMEPDPHYDEESAGEQLLKLHESRVVQSSSATGERDQATAEG
jgi:AcrR family transcriptional regulator